MAVRRKSRKPTGAALPFASHAEFKNADLDARQALNRCLAEAIWSPNRLAQEAES